MRSLKREIPSANTSEYDAKARIVLITFSAPALRTSHSQRFGSVSGKVDLVSLGKNATEYIYFIPQGDKY